MFDYFNRSNEEIIKLVISKFRNYIFDETFIDLMRNFIIHCNIKVKVVCIIHYICHYLKNREIKACNVAMLYEILGYIMIIKMNPKKISLEELTEAFPQIVSKARPWEIDDVLSYYSIIKFISDNNLFHFNKTKLIINICSKFESSLYIPYVFSTRQSYHVNVRIYIYEIVCKISFSRSVYAIFERTSNKNNIEADYFTSRREGFKFTYLIGIRDKRTFIERVLLKLGRSQRVPYIKRPREEETTVSEKRSRTDDSPLSFTTEEEDELKDLLLSDY